MSVDSPEVVGNTLPHDRHDYPDWHRGRSCFALWGLELITGDGAGADAVERRLTQVRTALHPLLLPGHGRQPHVTVHVCGFPAAVPSEPDDYGARALHAHVEAIRRLMPKPFDLHIGDAFSFVSAACLSACDRSGTLQRLRAALGRSAPSFDVTPYVPHVTAGLYAGHWPLKDVQQRLQPCTGLPEIRVQIASLAWMVYDSREIDGPLRTLLRIALTTGAVELADAAGLAQVLPDGVFDPVAGRDADPLPETAPSACA